MHQRAISSRVFVYVLLIFISVSWIILLFGQDPRAVDFFPLYFAADRTLSGLSPYGTQATSDLQTSWEAPFAQAGIAYPLPLILLIIPFSFLPFSIAALLWSGLGIYLSYYCVIVQQKRIKQSQARWLWLIALAAPLAFLPFHRSVVMGQATLIWFGLAAFLVYNIQQNRPKLVALCIVLLVLKPQNGILFAAYGAYWLLRHHPRVLVMAGVGGGLLVGVAFALQPSWMGAWLRQLTVYRTIVQPSSLLPWGLLVVLACWRLEWWAKLAVAQVILFPLSDLYSGLPLLLAWSALPPVLALAGAGISWLWMVLALPNSIQVFWLLIVLPLLIAVLWTTWQDHRQQQGS